MLYLFFHLPVVIDTHIHFHDPGRPEGVPWPPLGEAMLSRAVRPGEWEEIVRAFFAETSRRVYKCQVGSR